MQLTKLFITRIKLLRKVYRQIKFKYDKFCLNSFYKFKENYFKKYLSKKYTI